MNGEDDGDARTSHHYQIRRTQHQQHLHRQREHPLKKSLFDGAPCEGPDPENCGCPQVNQADYRGTISKTISGRTCQNWADDTPHFTYYQPSYLPEDGLDANYCRNPNTWGYDRAWCYTTDPDVEWEYCDVPFCPLEPTISPAPTLTKLPSESPTLSVSPSTLPSSSGSPTLSVSPSTLPSLLPSESPTMSASPSTVPSISPTYTGGCMNLSIAVLFPAKTFTELGLNWRVNTTTSDGNEVTWEIPYVLGSSDKEVNSIVVEHANGTNSLDEEICLPAGRYSFGYSNMEAYSGTWDLVTYSENGWGVSRTMFVLLSGDEQIIACGDLFRDDRFVLFDLPLEQQEDSKKCSGGINDILTPMQCYQQAFNFTDDDFGVENEAINRNVWFNQLDQECGSILSNACKNRMDTLGFDDAMGEAFCAYFECAYPDPEGTYPSCECLYHKWDCNHGSGCVEGDAALECCESGGNDCHCVLMKDECDDGLGDVNKCTDYANHCCLDSDHECNCKYKRHAVLDSIQQNKDWWEIIHLLGELDESCFGCDNSSSVLIGTGIVEVCEGACTYWEKICVENPGGICNYAADRCCSYNSCGCDFKDHTQAKNGYDTDYNLMYTCNERHIPTLQEEKKRLIDIYERNNGEYWINNEGWIGKNTSQCDWYGITCDSEGYIQAIDLNYNNVTGSFPSYAIESLFRLESLKMSGNKLDGNFHQYFSYDHESGLTHIDLSQNYLSGNARLLLSPSIREVNISHNRFTSIQQFREWKRGYNSLVSADVSHNDIKQDCSDILTIVPPNIRVLRFNDNSIHGQLPSSLPILEGLRELFINNNRLSGTMPSFAASLPMIEYLNLANQTNDDDIGMEGLTGTIPLRWSNLIGLKLVDLSYNRLTKNIPADLASLPSLEILNVSNNMLGSDDVLPKEFGKLAANLLVLDASYNRLEGLIPVPEFTSAVESADGIIKLSGNTNM